MATASARTLVERRRGSLFRSSNEEELARKDDDSSALTDVGGGSGTFRDGEDGVENVCRIETVKARSENVVFKMK